MKIKVHQLSKGERNIISDALRLKAEKMKGGHCVSAYHYLDIAIKIRHGELLLCEYQYNEHNEKGGEEWN